MVTQSGSYGDSVFEYFYFSQKNELLTLSKSFKRKGRNKLRCACESVQSAFALLFQGL